MLTSLQVKNFRQKIYSHFKKHQRNLPWRMTRDPYQILVSEVMLQQTQAGRVVPKFKQFIKTFPNFRALDRASLRQVMGVWQGMGYNRRALALKKIAHLVVTRYAGQLPRTVAELDGLPGVGPATAQAILAYAFNQPTVFIETNIRSVFLHFFFKGRHRVLDRRLLPLVEQTLDRPNPRRWYWALMDYGAWLKRRYLNPSRRSAHYLKHGPFKGSERQIRGQIVRTLTGARRLSQRQLEQRP